MAGNYLLNILELDPEILLDKHIQMRAPEKDLLCPGIKIALLPHLRDDHGRLPFCVIIEVYRRLSLVIGIQANSRNRVLEIRDDSIDVILGEFDLRALQFAGRFDFLDDETLCAQTGRVAGLPPARRKVRGLGEVVKDRLSLFPVVRCA